MPAGRSDYVGRDGGAHHDQRRSTNIFILRHLVAMSLTAMWHLVSLSVKKQERGEHLLWMAMLLYIVTVGCCSLRGMLCGDGCG